MSDESQTAAQSFATDDEVLAEAFRRFKNETRCLAQEIIISEGRLVFGPLHILPTYEERSQWVWSQPTTVMFVLVIVTPADTTLGYRGKTYGTTIIDFKTDPKCVSYRPFDDDFEEVEFDESQLRAAAHKIKDYLKPAC